MHPLACLCLAYLLFQALTLLLASVGLSMHTQGGVNGLTKCMALALAPHGIRVNGIGPGSIATDVLASVATDEVARNRILSRTPMG
jgi:NAD(P)-dependent dehydrogenase (short-subunit alcohol dehydrogenase family)